MEKRNYQNKSLESGQINIGISETAMRLYLLDKLQEFHKDYPHVRLKISNHSTPQAIDALEKDLLISPWSPLLWKSESLCEKPHFAAITTF